MSTDKPQDTFFKIRRSSDGLSLRLTRGSWSEIGKAYVSRAGARTAFTHLCEQHRYNQPKDEFQIVEYTTMVKTTEPIVFKVRKY